MAQIENSFPPEVIEKIGTYVYRLIDPRTGETFYVGKGKGNRVFSHVRGEAKLEGDDVDNKIKRIREIRLAGFEVAHVIHRHGLDDETAVEVEAALIDAYPGLTNIAGGYGESSRGVMHAHEIIMRDAAKVAEFHHKALLINVNRSSLERSLFEATRYSWKIDPNKAKQADVILAVVQGLIKGVFVAREWLQATAANFPGRADGEGNPDRFGFNGYEASEDLKELYMNKRIPEEYRKPGAANPIKYTW